MEGTELGSDRVKASTDAGNVVRYDLSPHTVKASTDAGDIEVRGR